MMYTLHKAMDYLFSIRRGFKTLIIVCMDCFFLVAAFYLAIGLKQGQVIYLLDKELLLICGISVTSTALVLNASGFYQTVTRYISLRIFAFISFACFTAGLIAYISSRFIFDRPISVATLLIYIAFVCLFVGGFRLSVRSYFSYRLNTEKKRVLIYGAGAAGQQLAMSFTNGTEFFTAAFIDDNKDIQGSYYRGVKVHSPDQVSKLVDSHNPSKILLAIPSASRRVRRRIVNKLESYSVSVQTIPGISDLVEGRSKIDEIQNISINDLLGRDPVPPKKGLLETDVQNKNVMVTGAGGSIGSELCRQILLLKPKMVILYEISEFTLYALHQEFKTKIKKHNLKVILRPILGSVQNQDRLLHVIKTFEVQTLYHAAAYKHVPMVEYNVVEGVLNNVFGTLRTAYASIDGGVETFVLISTDKAVRPTNVMGATKRMAELLLQALANEQKGTRFCMVRFGNVLGSSGSVVPLFKKQIEKGGPLTVTHPDIIRYFMTIPEAAQLVIQAGALGKGGDVFVLEMGAPVKIASLAKKMVHLMGLEVKDEEHPDGDIEIKYTGLRPGEKLYEELLIGDTVEKTEHPLIMTAKESFLICDELVPIINELERACAEFDQETIRHVLLEAPTGFKPSNDISDFLWLKENEHLSHNL